MDSGLVLRAPRNDGGEIHFHPNQSMLIRLQARSIHAMEASMFDLNQLRCFVTVAEELHFGRAAARLNMTQPPLSRQVQVLEHIVDAALLERTSRSVKLTPAGRSFLPEAR